MTARGFRRRLADLTLPDLDGLAADDAQAARAAAGEFVIASIAAAPGHIRIAAGALTACLWLWTLPAGGLPDRPEGRRWRWARAFQRLPGPGAMIFRLYGNLAAFAFFEHPAVARHLGLTPTADRQARFRAKAGADG